MTKTFCDWCGKELADGPVGAIVNVSIQPAYGMETDKWEICPEDAQRIRDMANETVARQA